MYKRSLVYVTLMGVVAAGLAHGAFGQGATTKAAVKKPTLAVLPFVAATGDAKERELADRMRFAVSQKLSTDQGAVVENGAFDRVDNLQIDKLCSALEISFGGVSQPNAEEMGKLLEALDVEFTIAGTVKGRELTLTLYEGKARGKSAVIEVPADVESPKLAVEKVLTELTGTAFARIRDKEVDHSDAQVEARVAARPNLMIDPGFEMAATDAGKAATNWQAILEAHHYSPPLLDSLQAAQLEMDRVAVVPKVMDGKADGLCLMMRMSQGLAENNGLACESTWIAVEANKKYRFSVRYHSEGPTARLFLKGFANKPDQYGDKDDPEAARREFYRAQVLPRKKNIGWEMIEMDFTPSVLKGVDAKIEWLRVDLYVYEAAGVIYFDDVSLKKVDE